MCVWGGGGGGGGVKPSKTLYLSSSQTNDHGLCFANKTTCVHAYKIRKWCPLNGPAESHQTLPSPCVTLKAIRAGVGWVWLTRLGSAVNTYFDYGKFEAMKTLSGHRARAVVSISFALKL